MAYKKSANKSPSKKSNKSILQKKTKKTVKFSKIALKTKSDNKLKKIIFTSATTIIVFLIFFNSMRTGAESSSSSSMVLNWLHNIFNTINITEYFIRKTAHFIEFLAFGSMLTYTVYVYTKKILDNIFTILFFGLLIPVCDESIQMFSSGRSSLVSDILLDFSGVLTGIVIVSVFKFIKNK